MRVALAAGVLLAAVAKVAVAAPVTCGIDTEVVSGCPVAAPGDYAEIRTSTVVDVQPVTQVTRPPGSGCTLGALLRDERGRRYFTYAGHCAVPAAVGAPVLDRGSHLIGTLAFAAYDHERGVDIALVQVAAGRRTDPAVRGWGGPTGLLTGVAPAGPVRFSGSSAAGLAGQARSSTTVGIDRSLAFRLGPEPVPGDSGSPILLADGRLAGEFIGYLNGSGEADGENPAGWADGPTYAYRMDRQIAIAAGALRTRLTLLTAPLNAG
jgi:hypothetical protein